MSKQRLARMFVAVAVVAGLGVNATPAAAEADADAATCSISGSAAWNGAVTAVPTTRTFSFALTWSCSGTGDEVGIWNINFIGTSLDESCVSGHATAGATGGIEGQGFTAASVAMSQTASSFTFDGTLTSSSETHHVHAQVNVSVPLCPWPGNTAFSAGGSGTLADA